MSELGILQLGISPPFQTVIETMSLRFHMGREHASREKKLPMVNFLIFVHKNVYRIRFQEIKIRP